MARLHWSSNLVLVTAPSCPDQKSCLRSSEETSLQLEKVVASHWLRLDQTLSQSSHSHWRVEKTRGGKHAWQTLGDSQPLDLWQAAQNTNSHCSSIFTGQITQEWRSVCSSSQAALSGVCVCFRGRLLVGTFVALFFNLLTLLSVKNKPFVFVSGGKIFSTDSCF